MKMKQVIRELQSHGFRAVNGNGSRWKIYPPDPKKPFYSMHSDLNEGEKAFHPLRRFARSQWSFDLVNMTFINN